jgi:metal-responsive CopG/Arc/MetJ family transcriptional regulator
MKVAVSIADPIFEAAERASKRMRVSRSHFYAAAVEAYIRDHSGQDVTERLNAVYRLDPALESASLEVLRREKW